MNREDIIRMARRYGCVIAEDGPDSQCEVSFSADQLLALLQVAVAAEREACAKVCDDLRNETHTSWHCCRESLQEVAKDIRARGQP